MDASTVVSGAKWILAALDCESRAIVSYRIFKFAPADLVQLEEVTGLSNYHSSEESPGSILTSGKSLVTRPEIV